jgi:hypothetical protein
VNRTTRIHRGRQGGVSSSVAAERRVRAVGFLAVGLDDQAVRRPVEVDLDAPVVESIESRCGGLHLESM